MSITQTVEQKLRQAFAPMHLEVVNESHKHNVPAGSETHFKVLVVSEEFGTQKPLARHRAVHSVLAAELAGPVHALALHAWTPDEWFDRGGAPESPPCLGGGHAEKP